MTDKPNKVLEAYGVFAVALLLILTAWGHALVMLGGSMIAFVIGALLFRRQRAMIAVGIACRLSWPSLRRSTCSRLVR